MTPQPDPTTLHRIRVACSFGLEEGVANELRDLGVEESEVNRGSVRCLVDAATVARIVLGARSASRVVLELSSDVSADKERLADAIAGIEWEDWMPAGRTFAVRATGRTETLRDTRYTARFCKDHVCRRFAQQDLPAPPVSPRSADFLVDVLIRGTRADIGVELSGRAFARRAGERTVEAPLREDVAAGLAWITPAVHEPSERPLVDPFCGSGRLLCEAAAVAHRLPPSGRESASAWMWPRFARHRATQARFLADRALQEERTVLGFDEDARAIGDARRTAATLGLRSVSFEQAKCESLPERLRVLDAGLVLTNPPWGRRLGDADRAWTELGQLARTLPGWHLAVLSGDAKLTQSLRLKAHARHPVAIGGVDCRLLHYMIRSSAQKG